MCKNRIDENLLNKIELFREKLNAMLEPDNADLCADDVLALSRKLDRLIIQYENRHPCNCSIDNQNRLFDRCK
ncbi:Spo0E like sporulation regulatory protein [Peptoclostridium litorale DSM 5388]|uniref:Spo0E like sporulation regulatory protein n=1 Tax=Peptoclostridium litorale DSM 5388 TaxID=1121324 RepID=A0A069REX5_PEPLI|nr:hypothetical protein CLIT_13c00720 [Peptoclostridium litorale DSM 5388]SIN91853.1 Spo0E like sporulation regulatory protein [Peptoclostridium litorale DSM 5388]